MNVTMMSFRYYPKYGNLIGTRVRTSKSLSLLPVRRSSGVMQSQADSDAFHE